MDTFTATMNITWTACGFPDHDEYTKTMPVRTNLFVFLPTLSFVLRMVVKGARLSSWGADDTTIVVAYVSASAEISWLRRRK